MQRPQGSRRRCVSVLVVETPEGAGLYSPQTSNRTILGHRHVKGPNILPIKSPDTSGTARVRYSISVGACIFACVCIPLKHIELGELNCGPSLSNTCLNVEKFVWSRRQLQRETHPGPEERTSELDV